MNAVGVKDRDDGFEIAMTALKRRASDVEQMV
jgi:hypothetical protein